MKRRNFSPEFKRESAQLVIDQNYTVSDDAKAMGVGLYTMMKWVKQLRDERRAKTQKKPGVNELPDSTLWLQAV